MAETVILCAADEVVEGEIKQAPLPDGSNVALYRVEGAIYATADMCTHGEASLAEEGIITGNTVECTFHFGTFDVTTGMAREFARDGITVNTVAPCAVNTPQMAAITKSDPALAAKFVSVIPMGRPAEMEEVASMVSYLASAEASFVTGQVISVNGGSTML